MTLTIFTKMFQKSRCRITNYRSHNYFCNKWIKEFLTDSVSNQIYVNNYDRFNKFFEISIDIILSSFCPIKKKFVRKNQFSRKIMKRSRLKKTDRRRQKKLARFMKSKGIPVCLLINDKTERYQKFVKINSKTFPLWQLTIPREKKSDWKWKDAGVWIWSSKDFEFFLSKYSKEA